MPAAVEKCVLSLTAKWEKDPSSRPTPRKTGKDGKQQDMKSQAWAICTAAYQKKVGKMEEINLVSLEGIGPTVLGGAVTNRPHILGLPEIEVVEEEGEKKLVVPFLRHGNFRHHTGLLKFNDGVFDKMIENYKSGIVGRKVSIDHRHKPDFGAVGWFEDMYRDNGILYVKAKPTPKGLALIEDGNFKYASIEFNRDWESPEIKFDSEEIEDIETISIEEEEMDETLTLEELRSQYQAEVEARQKLETQMKDQSAKLVSLEESYQKTIADLERQNAEQLIGRVLLEAENYRADGKGHPKALLEWAGRVMRFEPVGEEDATVSLEDDTPEKHRAYLRKSVAWLLSNLPGTVPLEDVGTRRETETTVELDAPSGEYTDEEKQAHKDFWEA